MGLCWSNRIKSYTSSSFSSSSHTGLNSKYGSRDGKALSSSSSKVSLVSVPQTPRSECEILQSSNLKTFTFRELKTATRNFRPDSVLGEGGFGSVFKGWVDEHSLSATRPGTGMVIAVKRLNQQGFQGHKEWLPLSWNLRMKVALGAARGLAFLHSAEAKVIYRDFKTSNILLDSNYNAKLSDFGLARDAPTGDNSHVSTRIMGTHGYAAPEYLARDKNRPPGQHNLVGWAKPYLTNKRRVFHVLDARLEGQCARSGVQKLANLALQCLATEPKFRPNMDEVVMALEQLQEQAQDEPIVLQKEHHLKAQRGTNGGCITYPRPSASPLYAQQS
ncbi:hypothetical protein OIU85_016258 [Salix viminalis]|uniref:Protein kinase domain-containing protein n=1 Tax=Salix viminalis TaxID=40686 RepID=A0A9Q0V5M6_SALVM|nr:hypothetical protein OIU85_016258 [Salix viminalis]